MSIRTDQTPLSSLAVPSRGFPVRTSVVIATLIVLVGIPPVVAVLNEPFYLDLVTRLMIFAIAAVSLDIVLGYGGMISFGHAAYLGIGGYAVGIFSFYGIDNGFLQWPVAIGASALVALIIGAISLRTNGMYFIMITLAFTQMLYFLGISLETYGGDDGMTTNRSEFAGIIDLYDANTFYYLVFVLLGLVLSQLVREGAPLVVPGFGATILNMRPLGGGIPDPRGIEAELAHYYGLPIFGIAGSGAKVVDGQASLETALTMQQATLSGANIIHDLGYMEGGLTGSLALFVISHELIGLLHHTTRAVEVNDETLALDLIDEVGPLGNFLDTEHTRRHYRQYWYPETPEVIERHKYDGWVAEGSTTLLERATARVDKILATHIPDPLPDDVAQAVKAVVRRAEEGVKK